MTWGRSRVALGVAILLAGCETGSAPQAADRAAAPTTSLPPHRIGQLEALAGVVRLVDPDSTCAPGPTGPLDDPVTIVLLLVLGLEPTDGSCPS